MSRDPRLYLEDMRGSIGQVLEYTRGLSEQEFEVNNLVRDAVLRHLAIIGEAAKHVPQETRDMDPTIPWPQICGLRDHLVHAYFGVDEVIIWNVIKMKLPGLLDAIRRILIELDAGLSEG